MDGQPPAVLGGGLARSFATRLREVCVAGRCYDLLAEADTPAELLRSVQSADRGRRLLLVIAGTWLRDEGLDLLQDLQRLSPSAAVLLVGADLETLALSQALRLGLRGLAEPDMDARRLGRALDVIASGELWISRQLLLDVVGLLAPPPLDERLDVWLNLPSLTSREHDVLKKILDGKSNKSIANDLGISEKTVKIHLQHLYRKLGVHRRVDLLKAFAVCRPAA